jgi:translation initiation factor 3 subunit C
MARSVTGVCATWQADHYCQPDAVITALESALPPLTSSIWASPPPSDPTKGNLVRALCVYLYKPRVDARLRSRAVLCHVFHHALHNEFYRARDMLLMSHVHQSAHNMDVDTQILYNRTVAQLGLSAFRNGLIEETESLLRDLYANPTLVKERLAQGTQRRGPDYAVAPEQEKLEKARQLPFHQHINLELLECAYLVSSMLIEVPQMALEEYDPERKRDIKSRMFRRQLDSFDKQIFAGPPENKREHVVQAAKALQVGEWRKCIDLIDSIKVWSLMPSEKDVKAHLARCVVAHSAQ